MAVLRTLVLGAALAACWSSSIAAPPPPPPVDQSGKGAVLCVWMLTSLVREASRRCDLPDRSRELDRELDNSIERIEAFIMANASSPPKDIRKARKAMIADQTGRDFCKYIPELYSAHQAQGAAALREGIDELLSVPREPLMNPCV